MKIPFSFERVSPKDVLGITDADIERYTKMTDAQRLYVCAVMARRSLKELNEGLTPVYPDTHSEGLMLELERSLLRQRNEYHTDQFIDLAHELFEERIPVLTAKLALYPVLGSSEVVLVNLQDHRFATLDSTKEAPTVMFTPPLPGRIHLADVRFGVPILEMQRARMAQVCVALDALDANGDPYENAPIWDFDQPQLLVHDQ
jgi:hypothetical protein